MISKLCGTCAQRLGLPLNDRIALAQSLKPDEDYCCPCCLVLFSPPRIGRIRYVWNDKFRGFTPDYEERIIDESWNVVSQG